MKKISRIAILFGAPGGINNSKFLQGVSVDLRNITQFLLSPNGGSWREDEIICINNASSIDVLLALANVEADYFFVYFSGHGFTQTNTGRRMVCFQDGNIEDMSFLRNSITKQTVVIDACRTYRGAGIGSIPPFGQEYFHFDGGSVSARQLFDEYIRTSPAGKMIIHGTQTGLPSIDSPYGGYFTQALLKVGIQLKSGQSYTAYSLRTILRYVPAILREHGNTQVPTIPYVSGNLQIPFAIEVPAPARTSLVQPIPQNKSNVNWGGVALVALLIAGLGGALD